MAQQKDKQQSNEPDRIPGTRRGEDIKNEEGQEEGRHEKERTGANRPSGGSTARDSTGVNPKDPIDPKSPKLIPQ